MRKVIGNRMYNTSTAKQLARRVFLPERDEPWWLEETLYETPRKELFLFGEGGAASDYPISRIEPVEEWEAQAWTERYFDSDTYIAIFGEPQ